MSAGRPLLILAAGILGGCGATQPDAVYEIRPARIDGVEVLILESFPAQATARIEGVLGDGCTELLPIEQMRDDAEIALSVLTRRPVGVACIQVVAPFEERVSLGTFDPGSYLLRANDVSVAFRVD